MGRKFYSLFEAEGRQVKRAGSKRWPEDPRGAGMQFVWHDRVMGP
jgi:hypothetical protein